MKAIVRGRLPKPDSLPFVEDYQVRGRVVVVKRTIRLCRRSSCQHDSAFQVRRWPSLTAVIIGHDYEQTNVH